MGKYYPSNYEKRKRHPEGHAMSIPPPASTRSAPQVPTIHSTEHSQRLKDGGDVKRKLQQYQRDMIAQATLAARKILGDNAETGLRFPSPFLPNLPANSPVSTKPTSPRLKPLGSPGPVTPMELETIGGSYLDKGRGPDGSGKPGKGVDCFRALASEGKIRSGAQSPSVATSAF